MNKLSIFLIVISSLLIFISLLYPIYPLFEGDYLFTIAIIGVLGMSYGIFNQYNIVLWKKILFTIITSLIGIFILIMIIAIIDYILNPGSHSSFFFPF